MINRVLDISEQPARLSIRNGLLVVESDGEVMTSIPCEELAAVAIGHRQVVLTQSALSELAKAGALLITCDEKFSPVSMVLPLKAHHAQAERFRRQASMPLPLKKRLWKALVQAKIFAQARTLEQATGADAGLRAMASHVRAGDTGNVEARAARHYWSVLFPGCGFRRGNDDDGKNHLLNYGYGVLQSMTARALCAAGLHPTFSLFHKNVHNPFGLADDLMEPFRPIVDLVVYQMPEASLTPQGKHTLISALIARYTVEGEDRALPDILIRTAQSLAQTVMDGRGRLWLPALTAVKGRGV